KTPHIRAYVQPFAEVELRRHVEIGAGNDFPVGEQSQVAQRRHVVPFEAAALRLLETVILAYPAGVTSHIEEPVRAGREIKAPIAVGRGRSGDRHASAVEHSGREGREHRSEARGKGGRWRERDGRV